MSRMWLTFCLEKKVGKKLAKRSILQRKMQEIHKIKKKTRKKFSQLLILKANRLVGLVKRLGCLDGSFGKEIRDQYFN